MTGSERDRCLAITAVAVGSRGGGTGGAATGAQRSSDAGPGPSFGRAVAVGLCAAILTLCSIPAVAQTEAVLVPVVESAEGRAGEKEDSSRPVAESEADGTKPESNSGDDAPESDATDATAQDPAEADSEEVADPTGSAASEHSIESSIVRVLTYTNPPDFFSPWQRAGTQAFSGSGVIIEGNRILTNAHVVADAVGVEVKRAGSGEQFEAEVSFVGHDCDLALLTVADERFFEGTRPLPLGNLPPVNAHVESYGFPVGGETLSVTSGVISRIEVGTYAHANERLLVAQIDAPINLGNSGGPVLRDSVVVGVSMQMLARAENVGFMVPAPVVKHFLADVEDGKYDGFPQLGVRLQPLESPALRSSLGLERGNSGGLVTRVEFGGPADGVLRRGDVLLSVGGYRVAGDLTVDMPEVGRVSLDAVASAHQLGDKLPLSILRETEVRNVEVVLSRTVALVPGRRTGDAPEYFVFGGVVFQPLTREYLELYDELPPKIAAHVGASAAVTAERRQVIILSAVLPDAVGRGYLDWESVVVRTVNGVVPRDLAHLAEVVDAAPDKWLQIETEDGATMVLDVKAARKASPRVLEKYGIAHDRSANLRYLEE